MMNKTMTTLDCGEQLSITQLEEWYLRCLKIVLAEESVLIDVSRIQKIDTAALQLLYQFHTQAQQVGVKVFWSNISEHFQDVISLSGLVFTMEHQASSTGINTMEKN